MATFADLPFGVLQATAESLPLPDLGSLRTTCKKARQLSAQRQLRGLMDEHRVCKGALQVLEGDAERFQEEIIQIGQDRDAAVAAAVQGADRLENLESCAEAQRQNGFNLYEEVEALEESQDNLQQRLLFAGVDALPGERQDDFFDALQIKGTRRKKGEHIGERDAWMLALVSKNGLNHEGRITQPAKYHRASRFLELPAAVDIEQSLPNRREENRVVLKALKPYLPSRVTTRIVPY